MRLCGEEGGLVSGDKPALRPLPAPWRRDMYSPQNLAEPGESISPWLQSSLLGLRGFDVWDFKPFK